MPKGHNFFFGEMSYAPGIWVGATLVVHGVWVLWEDTFMYPSVPNVCKFLHLCHYYHFVLHNVLVLCHMLNCSSVVPNVSFRQSVIFVLSLWDVHSHALRPSWSRKKVV